MQFSWINFCICVWEKQIMENEKLDIRNKNPFQVIRIRSLLIWLMVSSIIAMLLAYQLKLRGMEGDVDYIWFLWFHLVVLAWCIYKFNKLNISFTNLMGKLPRRYDWASTIAMIVPLVVFSMGTGLIAYYLISKVSTEFAQETFSGDISGLQLFFIILLFPFVEELFFRGVLLHRWSAKWDIKKAVIYSSLVFATAHIPVNVLGAFVYGIALSVLYIKTHTLITPIIFHILINFSGLFIGVLWADISPETNIYDFYQPWFGILCMLISLPWVIRFIYKNWPSRNWHEPYFINHDIWRD
ncbi:CPBP family intramembrane metalloprotease [Candidatus Poribacteria bacterium]|nr:CPBP family intramembrane metalloprotease [Candidatus Poribacteria bacterium]